jgi:hypothetical protein
MDSCDKHRNDGGWCVLEYIIVEFTQAVSTVILGLEPRIHSVKSVWSKTVDGKYTIANV